MSWRCFEEVLVFHGVLRSSRGFSELHTEGPKTFLMIFSLTKRPCGFYFVSS